MTMMQTRAEAGAAVESITPSPLHQALGLPGERSLADIALIMTGMGAEQRRLVFDAATSEVPGQLGEEARDLADRLSADSFAGKGQPKQVLGLSALNSILEYDQLARQ